MRDKTGFIDNGVEGTRTGGVSQTTGDWITSTAVGEG